MPLQKKKKGAVITKVLSCYGVMASTGGLDDMHCIILNLGNINGECKKKISVLVNCFITESFKAY